MKTEITLKLGEKTYHFKDLQLINFIVGHDSELVNYIMDNLSYDNYTYPIIEINYGHLLSPYEQLKTLVEYIKYLCDQNDQIFISTFSPYVLNYLNILALKFNITIQAYEVYTTGYCNSLLCKNYDGKLLNTNIYSEPINYIYDYYNKLKGKK